MLSEIQKKHTHKPIGQKCEAIDLMNELKKENLLLFEREREREKKAITTNSSSIEHRASLSFKHSFVSFRFVHTQHILKLMSNCTAVTYSIGKDTEK